MKSWQERLAILKRHFGLRRGELFVPIVLHDDWCNLLVEGGDCNCTPDVLLLRNGNMFECDTRGRVRRTTKTMPKRFVEFAVLADFENRQIQNNEYILEPLSTCG